MLRFDSQLGVPLSSKMAKNMSDFCQKELPSALLKECYESIYELVGASKEDNFIFTSSGAEAINHLIFSCYLEVTRKIGKNHYICTTIEEAPTLMAQERLKELGCIFQTAPANEKGIVTPKAIAETISPRTALISLSWVNGLTGVIQPVEEISAICKERGILLHVEATHILGKGNYRLEECGADFLTFNGVQIHGPQGTGGLFFRKNVEMSPFIIGGPEQGHLRGGAFNESLLLGLGLAAKEAVLQRDFVSMETARMKELFEKKILEKIPDVRLLFSDTKRIPHITSFAFRGVHSEALCYLLSQNGLLATFGGGHFQHFPYILKACHVKEALCASAVSFGLNYETTEEDIEKGTLLIRECVEKLRKHSHCLKEEDGWD